jgi:hypothetical protein
MRIRDFHTTVEATKHEDIESALSRRRADGFNSFWLSHGTELFPTISITVKGDLAHLHYFPGGDHPGYASLTSAPPPWPQGTRCFFLRPREKITVRNDELVDFSHAVRAAQEFAVSTAKPKCIQWDSLVAGE